MVQAGEEHTTQEAWWNPAQAVIFLRDGTTPSATDSWFGLPSAVKETRQLNAAIQAGKIDVIELHLDGTRRQLRVEDRACIELHFRHFVGGAAGVKLEVVDTPTNKARRGIRTLLLRADDVRLLRKSNDLDRSVSPPVEPFRTGAQGRPTAKDLVLVEAAERISSGKVKPRRGDLARFAEELAEWWKQERQKFNPPGPSLGVGGIENLIRKLWNRSLGET